MNWQKSFIILNSQVKDMSLLLPTKGKGEGGKLENLTVHITLWQIYISIYVYVFAVAMPSLNGKLYL